MDRLTVILAVGVCAFKACERVLFKTLVDRIRPYSYGFALVVILVFAITSVIAFVIEQLVFKFYYKTSRQPLESFPKFHCVGIAFLDFLIFQTFFVSGSLVPAALTVTLLQVFIPCSIIFTLPCCSCFRYSWMHHLCALLVLFGISLNAMPYLIGSYVYAAASALGVLSLMYKNYLFSTQHLRVLHFNAWSTSIQFVFALLLAPAGVTLQFYDDVGPRTDNVSVFGEVVYNLQYMLQCLLGLRSHVYDKALPNETASCLDAALLALGFLVFALASDCVSLLLLKRRKAEWLHFAISLAMVPAFTVLQLAPLSAPSDGVSDLRVVHMQAWQHQACAFGGLVLVTGASVGFALLPQKMEDITTPSPFED